MRDGDPSLGGPASTRTCTEAFWRGRRRARACVRGWVGPWFERKDGLFFPLLLSPSLSRPLFYLTRAPRTLGRAAKGGGGVRRQTGRQVSWARWRKGGG